MHLRRKLLSDFRSRRKAPIALAALAVANQLTFVSPAAIPSVLAAPALHASRSVCGPDANCSAQQPAAATTNLSLPAGSEQCRDSGPAAACGSTNAAVDASAGTSSLPTGLVACAAMDSKPVPTTPAACTDVFLPPLGGAPITSSGSASPVAPSVPIASLGSRGPERLSLSSNDSMVRGSKTAVLTATANSSVSGTKLAIEIFDETSGVLVGACAQASQCSVAYAAPSGVHNFAAFVTPPTTRVPSSAVALTSNHVSVGWLDSGITASRTVVGPGQAVTVTATSTVDVRQSGRWLEIYDLTTGSRLTYCSHGKSCSTSLKETSSEVHELVGYVTGQPEAVSPPVYVTWVGVSLSATSIGPKTGGTIYLKATTNADLANTPWVVGIYDQQGRLVDHACKSGNTCSVQAWMGGGTTPSYTAVVGALPTSTSKPAHGGKVTQAAPTPTPAPNQPGLVDIQAKSSPVEPTHLLWGVDSCKPMTSIFSSIVGGFGTPEFWGRYLTDTVCPGLSSAEVSIASQYHIGLLPIYNDYNCSNVSYYSTGHQYAVEAAAAAQRIGIPKGRLIVVDIEPPGAQCPGAASVDSGFIEGWYDGIHQAGYVPGYYGNGTAGSEFALAWCTAVSALPNVAQGSDLWTFEPSLQGGYAKPNAPGFSPYDPGCAGNMLAWQYELGGALNADVDQDEAISSLPLWYP